MSPRREGVIDALWRKLKEGQSAEMLARPRHAHGREVVAAISVLFAGEVGAAAAIS